MITRALTRKQVAEMLGFKSIRPVIRLEKNGELNPFHIGRSVRFDPEEVGGLLHQKNSEKSWNNYKECGKCNEQNEFDEIRECLDRIK